MTEAYLDRSTNIVSADLVNQAAARLVCAAYDRDGRMIRIAQESVAKDAGSVSVSLPGEALPGDVTVKLFLVDSRFRPLCPSFCISS